MMTKAVRFVLSKFYLLLPPRKPALPGTLPPPFPLEVLPVPKKPFHDDQNVTVPTEYYIRRRANPDSAAPVLTCF
jgi:hypothetical protein